MTISTRNVLVVLATLATTAASAQAYMVDGYLGYAASVKDKAIRFYAGKTSFPAGGIRRTALMTAFARWKEAPGSFQFHEPNWDAEDMKRANGDSEMWFTNSEEFLSGAPAMNMMRTVYGIPPHIIESDIVFRTSTYAQGDYTEARDAVKAYGGDMNSFHSAVLHEAGHALGLRHENRYYQVMGTNQTHLASNAEFIRAYVGEDAGNGEVQIYGVDPVERVDVGVSHWKYGGKSKDPQYSKHIDTKIYPLGGGIDPIIPEPDEIDGSPVFLVDRGATYDAQFTYENNGLNPQLGVVVRFYISTNNSISTFDRHVSSATLNLTRNLPLTTRISVPIPVDLTHGAVYWLGVVLDPDDDVAEVTELNNAASLVVRAN